MPETYTPTPDMIAYSPVASGPEAVLDNMARLHQIPSSETARPSIELHQTQIHHAPDSASESDTEALADRLDLHRTTIQHLEQTRPVDSLPGRITVRHAA